MALEAGLCLHPPSLRGRQLRDLMGDLAAPLLVGEPQEVGAARVEAVLDCVDLDEFDRAGLRDIQFRTRSDGVRCVFVTFGIAVDIQNS